MWKWRRASASQWDWDLLSSNRNRSQPPLTLVGDGGSSDAGLEREWWWQTSAEGSYNHLLNLRGWWRRPHIPTRREEAWGGLSSWSLSERNSR